MGSATPGSTGKAPVRHAAAGRNWQTAARWSLLGLLSSLVLLTTAWGVVVTWTPAPVNPVPPSLQGQELADYLVKLDENAIAALEKYAVERLKQDSLDTESLRLLGIVLGLRKLEDKQNSLAANLARYTLRDPYIQMTAINIALQQQRYQDALLNMDGLLRARPELGVQMYSVLGDLVSQSVALPHVASKVAENPPWRGPLIRHLLEQSGGWQSAYRLLAAIRQAGHEVPADETRSLLAVLVNAAQFEQAYFVWLDSLDSSTLSKVQNVFDGGFEREPENLYFDWNVRKLKNGTVSVVRRPGSSTNLALKLDWVGQQGASPAAYQYLKLEPGEYVLRYDTLVQSMDSPRGLAWRLDCVDKKLALATSKEIKLEGPWTTSSLTFSVPNENCSVQMLQLGTAARSGIDTKLSGVVYFDDVSINKTSGK